MLLAAAKMTNQVGTCIMNYKVPPPQAVPLGSQHNALPTMQYLLRMVTTHGVALLANLTAQPWTHGRN